MVPHCRKTSFTWTGDASAEEVADISGREYRPNRDTEFHLDGQSQPFKTWLS